MAIATKINIIVLQPEPNVSINPSPLSRDTRPIINATIIKPIRIVIVLYMKNHINIKISNIITK